MRFIVIVSGAAFLATKRLKEKLHDVHNPFQVRYNCVYIYTETVYGESLSARLKFSAWVYLQINLNKLTFNNCTFSNWVTVSSIAATAAAEQLIAKVNLVLNT